MIDEETELGRTLELRHVSMITIGGMIGAGLFISSSAAISVAGPGVVFSYLIAGVLIFFVMRMIAEMAVALPQVRAFTQFSYLGLGEAAGFISSWLYWYFWTIIIPIEAIAGATLVQVWWPAPIWEIGLVLMILMTAVNLLSARVYGEFEFWFASIKVAAIVGFIVVAIGHVIGPGSMKPAIANLTAHGGFFPHGAMPVVACVATVFFSLMGAEITTVAAAESKHPAKAVSGMATSIASRVLLFYVVSIFLIVTVVPWVQIEPGKSPFTHALSVMGYRWASVATSFVILTAVLSCLNSAFYVSSRLLFALADRGDAPRWLVRLNRRHVPARSILVGTVTGCIGLGTAVAAPQGVFAFLVNASGALVLFIYIATAVAQIRIRRRDPAIGRQSVRMWLFPWLSYLTIAGMIGVLVAMVRTPSLTSQFYFSLLTAALVGLVYVIRWRFRMYAGPCVSHMSLSRLDLTDTD
jgi:GABA permease